MRPPEPPEPTRQAAERPAPRRRRRRTGGPGGATIRDVAVHAGVSVATVSRVLRNHEYVSAETRERVLNAVEHLRFTPSRLGRSLAERQHAANGIVFPDLSGPYFAEVVLGYEEMAGELGRSVLILSTHGRDAAAAMVHDLAGRCDGLVILGRTVPDDVVVEVADRGVPVVLLARPAVDAVDSVKADNLASAGVLARHLVTDGHRTFVFVGDPESSPDVAERWTGFQQGLRESGAAVDLDRLAAGGFGESDGVEAGARLLESRLPDAVVCANDELALGVLSHLRKHGVDVPRQVAVTGWDDVMAARYAGLTTVRQPMRELGAAAARLVDELIRKDRTEPRHDVLPTELVVRSSCAPHQEES